MSTNTSTLNFRPASSTLSAASAAPTLPPTSRLGAGPLSAVLLAGLVATLVLLADRFVSTWADEHLFLGWVLLWVVIFAGLALFAGTARALAGRAIHALDGWSQTRARARAETRLWLIAHSDPRVMADLVAIRARAGSHTDSSEVLAPIGSNPLAREPEARGWATDIERVGRGRVRSMHMHYI